VLINTRSLHHFLMCFLHLTVQDTDATLSYRQLGFTSEWKSLSYEQRHYLSLLEQLFNVEEPIHALSDLVRPHDLQVYETNVDENCLLLAVVDQLHQNNIVTDTQQLRSEAVKYLRNHPYFDDGRRLMDVEDDQQWNEYLTKLDAGGPCDHFVLVVLAEILQTPIILHSAADVNGWPLMIGLSRNSSSQSPPIVVGHVCGLNFVTLRKHMKQHPMEATTNAGNLEKRLHVSVCQFSIVIYVYAMFCWC